MRDSARSLFLGVSTVILTPVRPGPRRQRSPSGRFEAADAGLCSGHMLTTATADWTTYETIGGLKPDPETGLASRKDTFSKPSGADEWLVIES